MMLRCSALLGPLLLLLCDHHCSCVCCLHTPLCTPMPWLAFTLTSQAEHGPRPTASFLMLERALGALPFLPFPSFKFSFTMPSFHSLRAGS